MTRLSYPDQSSIPPDVRAYLAQLPQDAVIRTLSYSTETVRPFVALGQKMYTSLSLPERRRELAILAVATVSRCK